MLVYGIDFGRFRALFSAYVGCAPLPEDLIRIMYSFIMVRSRPTTRVPITQGEGLKNLSYQEWNSRIF